MGKSKEIILNCWKRFVYDQMTMFGEIEFKERLAEEPVGYKLMFLSSTIMGLTTYDTDLDFEFGKEIYEIMKAIYERKNFEYVKDDMKYKKFILISNILDRNGWLEWGTSIRGCWFDEYSEIELHDYTGEKIRATNDFIKWLLEDFLITE